MRRGGDHWDVRPRLQYNEYMISEIRHFGYFCDEYQGQQNMKFAFKKAQFIYPWHRKVKGDGNCFYRTLAFVYLKVTPWHDYNRLFERTDMICENVPVQFQASNFNALLEQAWNIFLRPKGSIKSQSHKQHQLEQIFNKSWLFDTLMIAYLRSINYQYLNSNWKRFASFAEQNTKDKILGEVKNFRHQSEMIQIASLAELLDFKLLGINITESGQTNLNFNEKGRITPNFTLFCRPGHYEILYSQQQYQALKGGNSPSRVNQPNSTPEINNKLGHSKYTPIDQVKSIISPIKPYELRSPQNRDPRVSNSSSRLVQEEKSRQQEWRPTRNEKLIKYQKPEQSILKSNNNGSNVKDTKQNATTEIKHCQGCQKMKVKPSISKGDWNSWSRIGTQFFSVLILIMVTAYFFRGLISW